MMKYLIGALISALFLIGAAIPDRARAQCNGQFPAGTVCGNLGASPAFPGPVPSAAVTATTLNVKSAACGAVGNGVADDTAAINTCIGLFNAAGNGVLYFPAGTYKTTAALTTISGNGIVKGDGITSLVGQIGNNFPTYVGTAALPATRIQNNTTTAALFTVTSQALAFQDLSIENTSGGTPVVGSAGIVANTGIQLTATGNTSTSSPTLTFASVPVTVVNGMGVYDVTTARFIGTVQSVSSPTVTLTANAANTVTTNDVLNFGGNVCQKVDYQNIEVSGFYVGVDVKTGCLWSMVNTQIVGPVEYGIRINNVVNTDAGDWSILNSSFYPVNTGASYSGAVSGIRIEGSGGGKIVNAKINFNSGTGFVNGIDISPTVSNGTSDLLIANSSIENFTSYGILETGGWPNITIAGVQFFTNGATDAMKFSSNRNITINGIVISGTYSAWAIEQISGLDTTINGLTWNSNTTTFGSGVINTLPSQTGNTTDSIGAFIGMGAGIYAMGAPSSGNNFPGSMGLNSGGRTDLWINATGNQTALTFSQSTTPQWRVFNDTSNVFHIWRGNSVGDVETFNNAAHINMLGGVAPTLTAGCNGAGSVVSGNDAAGTVTGQTAAATTCTLSFGTAYGAAPNCAVSGLSAPLTGAVTVATGSIIVNFASLANFKWSYVCHGA